MSPPTIDKYIEIEHKISRELASRQQQERGRKEVQTKFLCKQQQKREHKHTHFMFSRDTQRAKPGTKIKEKQKEQCSQ